MSVILTSFKLVFSLYILTYPLFTSVIFALYWQWLYAFHSLISLLLTHSTSLGIYCPLFSLCHPGPNRISNIIFKKCSDLLVPWMGHFFRATFNLKFPPNEWLTSKTVVIRNPGRPPPLLHCMTTMATASLKCVLMPMCEHCEVIISILSILFFL